MSLYFFKDILIATALAWGVCLPIGRAVLRSAGLPAPPALALPLGMGGWCLLILGLGVLGGLRPTLLIAGAACITAAALRIAGRGVSTPGVHPSRHRGVRASSALLIGAAAFYLLLVLASAFAPETAFDAINIYLPYAHGAARAHRLAFAPTDWQSSMPMLPVMGYVTSFAVSGLASAKLWNVLWFGLCGGLAAWFVKPRAAPPAAPAAAALALSSPVLLYEATTALIDIPLAVYSGVVVFGFLEYVERGERAWLRVSAIGLGLALGCKYHAAFWLAPLGVLLAW